MLMSSLNFEFRVDTEHNSSASLTFSYFRGSMTPELGIFEDQD
jgi:hypothetical protein